MSYPFVAAPDHWPRGGVAVKAVVVHMAEGGGTVNWLARNDGNSSHYVIEYTGRIVQMVQEARAAGSIDPTKVRTDDDAPFPFDGEQVVYGVTANKAALGADWRNPNAAVIAVEIEGYAKLGPNAAQREALLALVADIRSRHGGLPCLGHRDFQSYKACPGRLIPWPRLGGHGIPVAVPAPAPAGEAVKSFLVPERRTLATVKDQTWLYDNSALAASPNNVRLSPSRELVLVGSYDTATRIVAYEPAAGDANTTSKAMFVRASDIEAVRPAPDPSPYTKADMDKIKFVLSERTTALRRIAAEASAAAEQPPSP